MDLKLRQSVAVAFTIAVLAVPSGAENRLYIEDMAVVIGQTGVAAPVRLDNDQLIFGFSLSIQTDPGELVLTGVDVAGTAAADADWANGSVLDGGGRITWGVVMDIDPPIETSIPAGRAMTIAKLMFDVVATAETTTRLDFVNLSGSPAARNVLSDSDGESVSPLIVDGTVTIAAESPTFVRGDANGDGTVGIADPTYLLDYAFRGGTPPPCKDAADADDSGRVDVVDAVYILSFLFKGGEPPAAPYPEAGADPTPDALSCGT